MPHITIEYSANVATHHDIDALVGVVHSAALADGLASQSALRTRAALRDHYRAMTGDPQFAFIAIACRIGPGRSDDDKRSFIEAILDAAEGHLVETPLAIAWSIELTEIDAEFRINRNHVRTALENDSTPDQAGEN